MNKVQGRTYRLDNDVRMIGKTGTGQVVENGGYSTTLYYAFICRDCSL